MLSNLTIRNLAIVEEIELDFCSGMTVLTGETGAGKSILLNALQLALGSRASADLVRPGSDRLEVYASFDVTDLPAVQTWLAKADLDSDMDCILGRTIRRDGRSRASINGRPATVSALREIGDLLIDIHGQHEHHGLLQRSTHRRLLDESAQLQDRCAELDAIYLRWKQTRDEIDALRDGPDAGGAHAELLRYQVEELNRLNLTANELTRLESDHRKLCGATETIAACGRAADLLTENESDNALDRVRQAAAMLSSIKDDDPRLSSARDCLESAIIQLEEAGNELQRYSETLDTDPERLVQVENRLDEIQNLSRKHHVLASELSDRHQHLIGELQGLEQMDTRLQELEAAAKSLHELWTKQALILSKQRKKAAKLLDSAVAQRLHRLGLKEARFESQLSAHPDSLPVPGGCESVEFYVSMNAGQPPGPLAKVASGGELSRAGLAIRVVTAANSNTPCLVFDEVDSGIGGATAEIVGRQLSDLAEHAQVICITHLPQVASLASSHLRVSKSSQDGITQSSIEKLSETDRLQEIARMLGGVNMEKETLAHAKKMLASGKPTRV